MKKLIALAVAVVFTLSFIGVSYGQNNSAADILKSGLLGAGSGAVGGAVSNGDSNSLWKGALAGAGVNVVGGALLDVISQGSSQQTQRVYYQPAPAYSTQQSAVYYSEPVNVPVKQTRNRSNQYTRGYNDGYAEGYAQGYKAGYSAGYKEGYEEGLKQGLRNR